MNELFAFMAGIFTQAAYQKGWFDRPINYVKAKVKSWIAK
jgi:hypothetical protein